MQLAEEIPLAALTPLVSLEIASSPLEFSSTQASAPLQLLVSPWFYLAKTTLPALCPLKTNRAPPSCHQVSAGTQMLISMASELPANLTLSPSSTPQKVHGISLHFYCSQGIDLGESSHYMLKMASSCLWAVNDCLSLLFAICSLYDNLICLFSCPASHG